MEREQWLARRRECITGTDIGQIVGLSSWGGPLDVYCDKLGLTESGEETRYQYWGKQLEAIIAQHYAEENDCHIVPGQFVRDGIYGGTPDFERKDRSRGLEIKTSSPFASSEWGESGSDQVPSLYYVQCQWYMFLTGIEVWDLAVLLGGNDYRCYTIYFKPKLIMELVNRAKDFWHNNVLAKVPPPAGRASTPKSLDTVYRDHSDELVDISDDALLMADVKRLNELKKAEKDIAAQKDELEAKLKQEIADRAGLVWATGKITWKRPKPRKVLLQKELIEGLKLPKSVLDKYTHEVESSRRIYFKEKES